MLLQNFYMAPDSTSGVVNISGAVDGGNLDFGFILSMFRVLLGFCRHHALAPVRRYAVSPPNSMKNSTTGCCHPQ